MFSSQEVKEIKLNTKLNPNKAKKKGNNKSSI